MASPRNYSKSVRVRASSERLWPLVSDTDRLNKAVGLPKVAYEPPPPGGVVRKAFLRAGPLTLASWDEHPFDWITQTDRTLERHTRRVLIAEFGTVPVVGRTADDVQPGPGPYRWVVGGPADTRCGTANHVSGFGWCAYSLALVDAAGPVVGAIADPGRAQIHAAARGRGHSHVHLRMWP